MFLDIVRGDTTDLGFKQFSEQGVQSRVRGLEDELVVRPDAVELIREKGHVEFWVIQTNIL